jgi:glycosyltransferase involved in cell wall biosynthesis
MNDQIVGGDAPLKMAVCTQSISHFEVPMFRLSAQLPGLEIKVFYLDEVDVAPRFDAAYGNAIHWGGDLLEGYESECCGDARKLQIRMAAWGADVVMIYGYAWPGAAHLIISRWLRGQPLIHRGTLNYYRDPRARLRSRIMRPLGRWLLGRFNAHHYGGSYSRKVLLDAGAAPESLFFVPYSVDSLSFLSKCDEPSSLEFAALIRERAGWKATDRVLLFIGQHNWIKGPDIAMEIFRQYHDIDDTARLLVVGSGSMTESMKQFTLRHGLDQSVYFSGFVPSAETVPYYLASNLVLCTSRYETWARMINEAMLCRKPCIVNHLVAASGGLVDDSVNGYVVRELTVLAYVNAITRHFSMAADERMKMGVEARRSAEKFSYEININGVLEAARYASRAFVQ